MSCCAHHREASDSPFQKIIPHFPIANQFIHQAISSNGTIFVHCNNGISKGPVFVIAYLMQAYHCMFQEAANIVQQRRFCTILSDNFLLQLKEFEYIYPTQLFHVTDTVGDHEHVQVCLPSVNIQKRKVKNDENENADCMQRKEDKDRRLY
jgi:hypothetical protein